MFLAPSEIAAEPALDAIVSAIEEGTRRKFTAIGKESMLLSVSPKKEGGRGI